MARNPGISGPLLDPSREASAGALMAPVVEKLSPSDMISRAAYVSSMKPQAVRLSLAASAS